MRIKQTRAGNRSACMARHSVWGPRSCASLLRQPRPASIGICKEPRTICFHELLFSAERGRVIANNCHKPDMLLKIRMLHKADTPCFVRMQIVKNGSPQIQQQVERIVLQPDLPGQPQRVCRSLFCMRTINHAGHAVN